MENQKTKEELNKEIVALWFGGYWSKEPDLSVIDELAAPDMKFSYSLHEPLQGPEEIKAFIIDFRKSFPNLGFWAVTDLIAEGDYVVGQWKGGGTHTGPAYDGFSNALLPDATRKEMHFTGTSVLKVVDGKIVEERGLDDGLTAMLQLGLIKRI